MAILNTPKDQVTLENGYYTIGNMSYRIIHSINAFIPLTRATRPPRGGCYSTLFCGCIHPADPRISVGYRPNCIVDPVNPRLAEALLSETPCIICTASLDPLTSPSLVYSPSCIPQNHHARTECADNSG